MSWPVRSRQLVLEWQARSAGYWDIATVPSGKTWLLKELLVSNQNSGSGITGFFLFLSGHSIPLVEQRTINTFGEMVWGDRHVTLSAGQVLKLYIPFNGNWGCVVFGAQLG